MLKNDVNKKFSGGHVLYFLCHSLFTSKIGAQNQWKFRSVDIHLKVELQ